MAHDELTKRVSFGQMEPANSPEGNMRVLIAIAHHGSKNRTYLQRMIETFRAMSFQVDIVILSDSHKFFPDDIEVLVGQPSEDPWSLPFAHRQLFLDRKDDYDLYVYSEDDTLIEQRHLEAVLELTDILPDDYLVGSLRYEVHPDGQESYSSVHSHYRWDPTSVFVRSGLTFARFSNDHAAWYAVTREQLARAIASGGFVVRPHSGRYDMLVSAATDVFTQCGFSRVICLDRIDDLLVHHMPNVYLGQLGVDGRSFRTQIEALFEIGRGEREALQLIDPETRIDSSWNRCSHMHVPTSLAELVPRHASRILSVGATSGTVELAMRRMGHDVTTIPVDSVFAKVQRMQGLNVLQPTLRSLEDTSPVEFFDRILLLDLLPYLERPVSALRLLRTVLRHGGQLLATMPNHRRYIWRQRLSPGRSARPLPRSFSLDGMHWTDYRVLRCWLNNAGYDISRVRYRCATREDPFGTGGSRAILRGNSLAVWATSD